MKGYRAVSSDRLRKMFTLLPDGRLLWKKTDRSDVIGKIAGWRTERGYWKIEIEGRGVFRSRIVYCMTHGSWPKDQIDHINRNRLDDRPSNLRDATSKQNGWNQRPKRKISGLPPGVIKRGTSNERPRYCSRIRIHGQQISLGSFSSVDAAADAYQSARRRYFGEFA